MQTRIDVLDHGFVRLVSYMQPVPQEEADGPPIDPMCHGWTGDLEIVRNARVSYNADWRTGEEEDRDEKLVRALHRRGHTSPFEAMVFTFEIKCPIFVARQWHRHRTWSYNEISARYTSLDEGFYVPKLEDVGKQHSTEKQQRTRDASLLTAQERVDRENFVHHLRMHGNGAMNLYQWALDAGIPRELARAFLPVNAYTRFFGTVDLHNLFHFLKLRLDLHAQYEIQVYGEAILKLIKPICPIAIDAFEDSLRSTSRGEGKV